MKKVAGVIPAKAGIYIRQKNHVVGGTRPRVPLMNGQTSPPMADAAHGTEV